MTRLGGGISPFWVAKVVLSLCLVGWAVAGLVAQPGRTPFAGQALAVAGATVSLLHYLILKRRAGALGAPATLVTTGGLFRWIRHPMYLGDLALGAGCAMLGPHPGGWLLWVLFAAVTTGAARAEDAMTMRRFGAGFAGWKARTGLLLPPLPLRREWPRRNPDRRD